MKSSFLKLVLSVALCLIVGFLGSFYQVGSWYNHLLKPSWTPPGWIFGPVWTFLYILMGISLWLVWCKPKKSVESYFPYIIFGIQLFINLAWPFFFFYLKALFASTVVILLLWIAILINLISFSKYSKPSAWLLVPYLLWVSYATTLNIGIWWLNG